MKKKRVSFFTGLANYISANKALLFYILILIAVETVLSVSELGFIRVGKISITVLHIPAIIAAIIFGLPEGMILAGYFGFMSLMIANYRPENTLDILFKNPLISVFPRLMIPIVAWVSYRLIRKIADDHTLSGDIITGSFASICGSIANTFFVLLALSLIYPEQIGLTGSLSASSIIMSNLIALNIVFEIGITVACTIFVILMLNNRRMRQGKIRPAEPMPIRKTFQKWFLMFIVLTFFAMFIFVYRLQSEQDRQNANKLLTEKAYDLSGQFADSKENNITLDLDFGSEGYALIIEDGIVTKSGKSSLEGKKISELGIDLGEHIQREMFFSTLDGIPGACIIYKSGGTVVLAFLPETEIYAGRNRYSLMLLTGLALLFFIMFATITKLVQENVVQKILDVNNSLKEIRNGNLDEKVKGTGNSEFVELSLGINSTVDALKATMNEIADKNKQEMEFAREVQHSVLPTLDQMDSYKDLFEIRGYMKAAKEVGGDFYDYFMIGKDTLGMVIADVSGKGVPAALFMMTAKTLIKNFVLSGNSPAQALYYANMELCENNEKNMFVTAWLGILDLNSGILEFANAAHNPPLLKKAGESFVYMDYKTYKRSLMLGAMEGTVYENNRIALEADSVLFLYTDGVTEATNLKNELYGEKRLLRCLEQNYELLPMQMIYAVHQDIDLFIKGAMQFDDITMVVLKMNSKNSNNELIIC